MLKSIIGPRRPDGLGKVHIGDPRFDDWPVIRDFGDLPAARAWAEHLEALGITAVITSDWQIDRFGRGDIAVRVPAEDWTATQEILEQE